MTANTRTLIGLILLVLGTGGCSDLSSPAAPSGPPRAPTVPSEPRLITFTEQGSGFSTTDLYDVDDEILQVNSHRQLIWVADGTLLAGYTVESHSIDGAPIYWINGRICSPGCAFEIRFGAKDGQRRAYLTVDYGHDNPGTVVDVAVVQGELVVTPTSTYPPGSPTLSGIVVEDTPEGRMPVEAAEIAVGISSGWRSATTDARGYYEVRGLFDGAKSVHVSKEGYLAAEAVAAMSGDTTLDIRVVRR